MTVQTYDTSCEFPPLTEDGEYYEKNFRVEFSIQPAEPDVGIFDSYIDDYRFIGLRDVEAAYIEGSARVKDSILSECLENCDNGPDPDEARERYYEGREDYYQGFDE